MQRFSFFFAFSVILLKETEWKLRLWTKENKRVFNNQYVTPINFHDFGKTDYHGILTYDDRSRNNCGLLTLNHNSLQSLWTISDI